MEIINGKLSKKMNENHENQQWSVTETIIKQLN